jgi:phosphatidylglycerol:prolipoprotein diacylglycerol transferase
VSNTGQLFTALGYAVGLAVFLFSYRRLGPQTAEAERWKGWLVLSAGVLGGTLGAKATQWLLLGLPQPAGVSIFDPQLGGRTIVGGIICGWIAVEIAKWALRLRGSWGDPFALALAAGEIFGRLGCHFNQCCYGIPASLPQGLPFSVYSHEAWRLPTQLYSSLAALLIFLSLLLIARRRRHPGDLFRYYLVFYGLSRFAIEFLRYRDKLYFGLSLARWVCLELALAGLASLLYLHFSKPPDSTRNSPGGV